MTNEDRKEALKLQWERVDEFLEEIDITKLPKGRLTCAHNTYYALFHTICALNIEYNLPAPKTHKGVLSKLYHKFVKTGILTEEDNKACVRAEEIRAKSDYDGKYKPSTEELTKNYNNVKNLIIKIKDICIKHNKEQNKQQTTTPTI